METFVREDAFVFPDTEALVQYYATGLVDALEDRPADNTHRASLQALVAEQVERIIREEGVFRDPKTPAALSPQFQSTDLVLRRAS